MPITPVDISQFLQQNKDVFQLMFLADQFSKRPDGNIDIFEIDNYVNMEVIPIKRKLYEKGKQPPSFFSEYTISLAKMLIQKNQPGQLELPSNYKLSGTSFAASMTFSILDGQKNIGKISKTIVSFTPTFILYNSRNEEILKGHVASFSWGKQIIISDAQGKKLGTIQEEVFSGWTSIETVYSIYDEYDRQVAVSHKTDFLGTTIQIYSPNGDYLGSITRPYNIGADDWNVSATLNNADKRILAFIGPFKSLADEERKAKIEEEEKEKKEKEEKRKRDSRPIGSSSSRRGGRGMIGDDDEW